MRKIALILASVLLIGCPNPETGKVDPYLTAHMVITQTSLLVPTAEAIFNQWLLSQSDEAKIKKAKETFAKVKAAVVTAFKLAHDGVDIAKQAKEDPNVPSLLAQADKAWQDLRKYLDELLATDKILTSSPSPEKGMLSALPVSIAPK